MVYRFFTCIVATHAGMVSSIRSSSSFNLPSQQNGMLSYHDLINKIIRGFGKMLKSRSSSVHYHSTSELLRTL